MWIWWNENSNSIRRIFRNYVPFYERKEDTFSPTKKVKPLSRTSHLSKKRNHSTHSLHIQKRKRKAQVCCLQEKVCGFKTIVLVRRRRVIRRLTFPYELIITISSIIGIYIIIGWWWHHLNTWLVLNLIVLFIER